MAEQPAVRQLDKDEDSFFGLIFPLGYTPTGELFRRSKTLKEQAPSNIKNLLLTQKGERVGQPTFGSEMPSIFFNPITENIAESVELTIKEALEQWLPYITAENIVTIVEPDDHKVIVQMEFRVDLDDPDALDMLTFTFETGG